jgi:hypothetical protein
LIATQFTSDTEDLYAADLEPPSTRMRKVSTFLQKTLELLADSLDAPAVTAGNSSGLATPAHMRRAIDTSVLALAFEHSLALYGFRLTRRVVTAACRIIGSFQRGAVLDRLTEGERAVVLRGLEPLITARFDELHPEGEGQYEILIRPAKASGIERSKLTRLQERAVDPVSVDGRKRLLRAIWASNDVSLAMPTYHYTGFLLPNERYLITGSRRIQPTG